jgi:hypothetical protein
VRFDPSGNFRDPEEFKLDSSPGVYLDPVQKATSRKLVEQLQRARASDPEQIYRRCRDDFAERREDMQRWGVGKWTD